MGKLKIYPEMVTSEKQLIKLIDSGVKTFYFTNCDGNLWDGTGQVHLSYHFTAVGPRFHIDCPNEGRRHSNNEFYYIFLNSNDKMRLFTNYWFALAFTLRHSKHNKERDAAS